MNRKLLIILFLIIIIVAGLLLFFSESYPAALVNWHPVSLDSFNKESAAAMHYYQKLLEVYGEDSLVSMSAVEFQKEVQRAVLEKLIENKIVEKELENKLESKDLNKIVDKKIGEILEEAGDNIEEKVKTLYGISMLDFQREILEPQARLEVLQGRFILEGKDDPSFNEWFNSVKLQAKVMILVPNFHWGDGKVSINE